MRPFFKTILAAALTAAVIARATNVTLSWTYPATIGGVPSISSDFMFVWSYSSDSSLPFSSWSPLVASYASNLTQVTNAGAIQFSEIVALPPGNNFFVLQSSNLLGLSATSGVALLPPVSNAWPYFIMHN
jgi:hypothetical protein